MTDSLSQQILERLKLAGLDEEPSALTIAADILAICGALPNFQRRYIIHAVRELRDTAFFPSSKESQLARIGLNVHPLIAPIRQELNDFNERLELVEAHLDELNDLLIEAGIQDVQSSS